MTSTNQIVATRLRFMMNAMVAAIRLKISRAYYNFCAASAGTVCSQVKKDTTSDICPAKWKLPVQSEVTDVIVRNAPASLICRNTFSHGLNIDKSYGASIRCLYYGS